MSAMIVRSRLGEVLACGAELLARGIYWHFLYHFRWHLIIADDGFSHERA